MKVEVAEGKSEGHHRNPRRRRRSVDANGGGGAGADGATEIRTDAECYRSCVCCSGDGSLRYPAVLKGTGTFNPVVNVGNRRRGRGIRGGWCAATSPDRAGT